MQQIIDFQEPKIAFEESKARAFLGDELFEEVEKWRKAQEPEQTLRYAIRKLITKGIQGETFTLLGKDLG